MKQLSILLTSLLFFVFSNVNAQDSEEKEQKLTLTGYTDVYFAGYSTEVPRGAFHDFITVGARGNSFGLNTAQLGATYEHKKMRTSLTLHYGDIALATWNETFNTVQEANVGLQIADGVWLDAGLFTTHIGTESFLPKNNMLSSTAFKTYNEPFYQAGAKITFDRSENFELQLWVLNGYNSFIDNNRGKSVGILMTYELNESTALTYTNLYGRESLTDQRPEQFRFYQNLYINKNWNEKLFLSAGIDYGTQTNSRLSNEMETASMFAGIVTARYQFNPEWSITARMENFSDKNGFISGFVRNIDNEGVGLELEGYTLGAEFRPIPNAYLRGEVRYTSAPSYLEIFRRDNENTSNRVELLLTMGIALEKVFNL